MNDGGAAYSNKWIYLAKDFILIWIEWVTFRMEVEMSGSMTVVPGMGNMTSLLISRKPDENFSL